MRSKGSLLEKHRAGYANIIGKPNVGKSTLINELVGEKVAIASRKIQTTRHRIKGIVNAENHQVIFSDTPGIIENPKYRMQETMMSFVEEAWQDADLLLYITEPSESLDSIDLLIKRLKKSKTPVFIVINKIDNIRPDELLDVMKDWTEHFNQEVIFPVSAKKGINTDYFLRHVVDMMPEHPPYFDKDLYTDRSERFLVSELIRERIFKQFRQEIPYSVEVSVVTFKEGEERVYIDAEIFVNRKSQKSILIGKQGKALTKIGYSVRKELVAYFDKRVHLQLYVKVKEGWRDSDQQLNRFGYKS